MILLKAIVIIVTHLMPESNHRPRDLSNPSLPLLALAARLWTRRARAHILPSALQERRGRRARVASPPLVGASARSALRAIKFLSVLEQEKSGENLIPHLNTIIRKIVPETRASARSGIAILLTLKSHGEQIILRTRRPWCSRGGFNLEWSHLFPRVGMQLQVWNF